jgi:transposase
METLMGVTDARRLGQVEAALRGRITNREGAERAGLSLRQFKRLKAKVRRLGPAGIVHGNRGHSSARRIEAEVSARIEALLTHPTVRLNDHHIRDLLAEESLLVSADTVRRLRRQRGLPPKHHRRPAQHRRRREREAQRGALVLIDGSPFRWLGPSQPECCLIGTIDDASGDILSLTLRPGEDLHGFTVALRDLLLQHGVPGVLYGDRTSIAVRNDAHWTLEEELAGRQLPPHFGQMLEELGLRYLPAGSPEAKGRIERLWRTLQDRLAAELALHGITTLAAALAFLPGFIERFNRHLGQTPRDPTPAWRRPPRDLDRVLACRYARTVNRDNTVAFFRHAIQIPPGPHGRSYHRSRVEVRELLDGRRLVLRAGRVVAIEPAAPGPFTLLPRGTERERRQRDLPSRPRINARCLPRLNRQAPTLPPRPDHPRSRPAPDHPWRRTYKLNLPPIPVGARG